MTVTNADRWARVVQARTKRDDLLPQRVWTLRKGDHEAAIDGQGGTPFGWRRVVVHSADLVQSRPNNSISVTAASMINAYDTYGYA